jgi:hypothetical protein
MTEHIIAVMALQGSTAPFARGDVIVRTVEDTIFLVRRTGGPSPLTPEDYELLLTTGEATPIPKHPWCPGTRAWALRDSFTDREDFLEDAGDAVDKVFHLPGAWIALVDHEPSCVEHWYGDKWDHAYALLCSGQLEPALREARLAYCLAPDLTFHSLALLMLVYKRLNKPFRVTGILSMARNSRGTAFADRVSSLFEALDGSEREDRAKELFLSLIRIVWYSQRRGSLISGSLDWCELEARKLGYFDMADWARQANDCSVHCAGRLRATVMFEHFSS